MTKNIIMKHIVLFFFLKHKGDWDKIFKSINEKEKVTKDQINVVDQYIDEFICILDIDYPEDLKSTLKVPWIFKRGATYKIDEYGFYNFDGGIYNKTFFDKSNVRVKNG